MIVAAAGYGKSTALDADRPPGGRRLRARDLIAAEPPDACWIGVDDLDDLAPTDQRVAIRRLAALPPDSGFTMTARAPLGPGLMSLLRGQVVERGPKDLALGPHAIAGLLAEEYGVLDPRAAGRVFTLTAGWPSLVHLAADALARRADTDLADLLAAPGSVAATWIASNVLAGLSEPDRRTLGLAAGLGPVTQHLCDRLAAIGGLGPVDGLVDRLRRVGVLVPRPRPGCADLLLMVPAVAGVLARGRAEPSPGLLTAAARCYEDDDLPYPAARAWRRAKDWSAVERLVARRGEQMLWQGYAAGVVDLLQDLPTRAGSVIAQRTYADALRMAGDAPAALRAFGPLIEDAERHGWAAGLASRVATVHFTGGDPQSGLDVLDRVEPSGVGADQDGVEWRACRVQLLATLGLDDQARVLARQTLAVAEGLGQPRALAAAHVAMARTSTGSRKEAHHEHALSAATDAGDAMILVRVLVNHACLLLAGARYDEACAVSREAVRLAETGSPPGRHAIALHNLGEALMRLGEYSEAKWQLRRSVAICRGLGPGRSAMGLVGIAEIQRELGNDQQSRAAYQEAVDLAGASREVQVLVPALAGLARLRVATDPDAALGVALDAERIATPGLMPFALNALGWVALARGERTAAAQWAGRAVASARGVQAFDVLAEALELTAGSTDDPALARRALTEALSIWRDGGAGPAASRVEVLMGWLEPADGTDRSRARDAARRLQRLGIRQVHGRPVTEGSGRRRVAVSVLGGFQVAVDGRPVPLTAWRSRQARTLVKILAGHRGRPVTRGYLCDQLWPDDDPSRTGHRLSVLLATVRAVLDPERAWPPGHHVGSDTSGIWLDLRHVALDADGLLLDAGLAGELLDAGDRERAREILSDIDGRYRGDAFEDEPYEQWADGFREEVRAAWLRSVRHLATLHGREGRPADAQVLLVRLLAADPYDVGMHRLLVRTLVRSGRHGEARRAFDRWVGAMDEIEAPVPDEAVLAAAL